MRSQTSHRAVRPSGWRFLPGGAPGREAAARLRSLQRWAGLAGLCGALACGGPQGELPPLPTLVLDRFTPAVREQLEAARSAAEAAPGDASQVGALGRALYAHQQYRAAAQCFERSRGLEPDAFAWTYLLAVAQADLGDTDRALEALRAARTLRPGDLPTAVRLADLLEQSGQPEHARKALAAALELEPASPALHYRLGRLEAAAELPTGIGHLQRAVELEPDYREAHYALANAYRRAGRLADSARHLAAYEEADPAPRRHYADPLLDGMSALQAGSAQARFNEGHALQAKGDLGGARAAYRATLEIDPKYVQAHVNLIAIHGQLGAPDQAARHYEQAVALDASIEEAHYNYGVSRHFAGDFAGAVAAFRKALAINSQSADTLGNLGVALEALGRSEEAGRHFQLALAQHPAHPNANFHVGKRLADRGRYTEALPYLERAVATESEGTALHAFLLALVHRQLGELDGARRYGRLALQQARARGQTELAARIQAELKP